MTDLTNADGFELVDATHRQKILGGEDEYEDATDSVSVDRWAKGDHDRLYINGLETGDGYVDLAAGEADSTNWGANCTGDVTLDGDELTIEIGVRKPIYAITVRVDGLGGEGDADEADTGETETEVACDGGEHPSAHVSDEQIKAALNRHEDTDHEGAHTVADMRDLLDHVQRAVEIGWVEWMDNIEDDHSPTHVVTETADLVVLDTGEWQMYDEELSSYDGPVTVDDVARDVVAAVHHDLGRELTDHDWGVTYPLAVGKPDGTDEGQRYVESVINGIVRQGVSPGGAWAYYGVEIRGNSQSQWARRQGRDQSTVSEAVGRAKQALGGRAAWA